MKCRKTTFIRSQKKKKISILLITTKLKRLPWTWREKKVHQLKGTSYDAFIHHYSLLLFIQRQTLGKTVSKTVSWWTHNIEWPHICLSIKILALQSSAEEPACKIRLWKLKAQGKVNNKINFMILDNFSVRNDIL